MKISNDESLRAGRIEPITPAQSGGVTTSSATTPGASPAAQVELSAQAQAITASKAEAARFLPTVQAVPETRDDLVAKLKTQVESGTYHVSGADIAEQLLRRAKADNIQ